MNRRTILKTIGALSIAPLSSAKTLIAPCEEAKPDSDFADIEQRIVAGINRRDLDIKCKISIEPQYDWCYVMCVTTRKNGYYLRNKRLFDCKEEMESRCDQIIRNSIYAINKWEANYE